MKKLNWKIVNIAFWIEVVLSYIFPFKTIDGFQYQAGFPITFITIYNTKIGINPFMSMNLNPLALLANIVIIYLIISAFTKTHQKIKEHNMK